MKEFKGGLRADCKYCKHLKPKAIKKEKSRFRISTQVYDKKTATTVHLIEEFCTWCFDAMGHDKYIENWKEIKDIK